MDETVSIVKEALEANRDFKERLQTSEICVAYDDEHDMLFLTIGPPQDAVMLEIKPRLHIRLDPQTDRIVGVTITAFKKGFLRENADFRAHFNTVFGKPTRLEAWGVVPRTEAARKVSDALRGLVPA